MLAAPKGSDIQRKVVVDPHRADPRFPLSAPEGGPHSTHAFGFTRLEGEYRRSALGEYSSWRALEWKLRITECFII
ncbi:hypothetical protein PAXRUDRAFT_260315 [Paxillus rubicundulus Ve08.2h10]|uniref:Uncharacterized protein n=1 Tax=Paxillus rubicundulus Ve08.2h10 TaxID=930991 RepID=A0A0D0EB13_9AGAM|nr:hypothetical protein PAXRUDRAFT_260315 [Paxillus rubicundulus Ve08.2h10]